MCGGMITAYTNGINNAQLTHTFPTCKDFDEIKTVDDGTKFIEKIQVMMTN